MLNWLKLLNPSASAEIQEQIRSAELVKAICLVAFCVTVVINLPVLAYIPASIPIVFFSLVLCWVYISTFYLARHNRVWIASLFIVITLWLIATFLMLFMGGMNTLGLGGYVIVMIITSLLFGNRAGIAVFGLSLFASLAIIGASALGVLFPNWMPDSRAFIWSSHLGLFIVIGLLLQLAFRTLQDALNQTQRSEQALKRRAIQLQVAAEIARDATSVRQEEPLLNRTVELICQRFDFYHAAIFLIDETGEDVVLKATTSEAGKKMLAAGYRLKIGTGGIVGFVAEKGKARVAPDVGRDSRHLANPLLAQTRSEMALPLKVNGRVIGVLDVQSLKEKAFDDEVIAVLQLMADLLAVAIETTRLYEAAQDQLARLQELDRLKSEFMQNVSHELRTPLAIVLGYAELFEGGDLGELSEEQRGPLETIVRRLHLLQKLLDDILTIVEVEAHDQKRQPINLAQLILKAQSQMQVEAAGAGLEFQTSVATDLPAVNGVFQHLERAYQNLVSNAIKFTPPGGIISVKLFQENSHIILRVSDTGIGILPEQIERIFDRFYQVDGSTTRRYGGTGLGLSLVKEVIEDHGGEIQVSSQPNQGTTFQISLQASSE
jgi:signal transduction histidine kinase